MHGNVAEWVVDQYDPKRYATLGSGPKPLIAPVLVPGEARYPHVVRGGGFEDEPAKLRSAARRSSKHEWSRRDPQLPQSIWWHTDAIYVGFRLVRPVEETESLKAFRVEDHPRERGLSEVGGNDGSGGAEAPPYR